MAQGLAHGLEERLDLLIVKVGSEPVSKLLPPAMGVLASSIIARKSLFQL
jgi:hypothetical protein